MLPLLDATAPTLEQLEGVTDWLSKAVAEGPVFIHCALGHGRSATVLIAYLLTERKCSSVKDALAFVRTLRPGAKLNAVQRAVLEELLAKRRKATSR